MVVRVYLLSLVVVWFAEAARQGHTRWAHSSDVSTLDTPYGLHLAFGNGGLKNSSGLARVRCLWATARRFKLGEVNDNTTATCQYGTSPAFDSNSAVSVGRTYTYTAGNFTGSLHDVSLWNLPAAPGTNVYYRCGSPVEYSATFNFTIQATNVTSISSVTSPQDAPWIGVICDMGMEHSGNTVSSIAKAVKTGEVQMVVHGGDISYANDYDPSSNNAYVWQKYFDIVSAFSAHVPYMTCPGNHEAQFDFAAYLNWLPMPNISGSPFYHSFDYMGVHFTMISTEHDFKNGSAQQDWIIGDLKRAVANRQQVPWIVVVGHRPLYCSDLVLLKRCNDEAPVFRSYLEWILNIYKVDVYISGHNHQYERSYPVYNKEATQQDYIDPKAPVYIVDGAAGCKEAIDPSFLPGFLAPWRAKHSEGFGTSWLRMRATQRILQVQLVSSDDDKVVDEFDITRTT